MVRGKVNSCAFESAQDLSLPSRLSLSHFTWSSTEMFKGENNVLPFCRRKIIIWVNRTHCFRVKALWLKGRTLFLPLNISVELQIKWFRLRRLGRLRSYTLSYMLVIPWLMVHESYFEKVKIVLTFPSNLWYYRGSIRVSF